MLVLLGKPTSINVRKVLWTLDELGLEFRHEAPDQTAPEFQALNPNGLAPVLRDGALVLWESNTIIRYLAGRETRLLPADPQGRARIEQWMDWQAGEFNNAWRYAFQALIRRNPAYDDAVRLAASVAEWNRHVGILEAHLAAGGPYMLGAEFTLADIPIGLSLNRWRMAEMERPVLPAVQAYWQRLLARPAFLRHGANGVP